MNKEFSQEKIDELNKQQLDNNYHPYTCDRRSKCCEVNQDKTKNGVLIATTDGWICPCGKYKQNWYH